MAVVMNMADWRCGNTVEERKNWLQNMLEKPFYNAELHRVNMSRAEHPSQSNESVLDVLFTWAALYVGISAYWFVKYII